MIEVESLETAVHTPAYEVIPLGRDRWTVIVKIDYGRITGRFVDDFHAKSGEEALRLAYQSLSDELEKFAGEIRPT